MASAISSSAISRGRSNHRCGGSHPRAKLTDEQVREMRALYADWQARRLSLGYGKLASIYGCGQSTARDIITLRTRWDVR